MRYSAEATSKWLFFPGLPSWSLETVPGWTPGLWALTTPSPDLWLEWGLNQSCSSPLELFNAPSHSICRRREEVDSWLFVVGSQTASLTPGPSFAHNLGCRCPNDQCEAILDIFPMTLRTPQSKVFWPLLLNSKHSGVPKDSKSPTLGVWVSSSHLAKVGLQHRSSLGVQWAT